LLVNHKEKTAGFGRSGRSQPDAAAAHLPVGDHAFDHLDAVKQDADPT
jgi:hypothetical protein